MRLIDLITRNWRIGAALITIFVSLHAYSDVAVVPDGVHEIKGWLLLRSDEHERDGSLKLGNFSTFIQADEYNLALAQVQQIQAKGK
jgi:hypothetical protein